MLDNCKLWCAGVVVTLARMLARLQDVVVIRVVIPVREFRAVLRNRTAFRGGHRLAWAGSHVAAGREDVRDAH